MIVSVEVGLVDAGQPPRVVHSRQEVEQRGTESHRRWARERQGGQRAEEDSSDRQEGEERQRPGRRRQSLRPAWSEGGDDVDETLRLQAQGLRRQRRRERRRLIVIQGGGGGQGEDVLSGWEPGGK